MASDTSSLEPPQSGYEVLERALDSDTLDYLHLHHEMVIETLKAEHVPVVESEAEPDPALLDIQIRYDEGLDELVIDTPYGEMTAPATEQLKIRYQS